MPVERLVLQTFAGPMNAYLLHDGRDAFLVDPGNGADRLRAWVRGLGLEVRGVLMTHAHIDHIGALDAFPVPVLVSPADLALLGEPALNGSAFFDEPLPFDLGSLDVRTLAPGAAPGTFAPLALGADLSVSVLPTPGHTAGSVCYRLGDDLITGDTLFAGSVGRADFPTGDAAALRRSILGLLDAMPGEVRVHPGHGRASTIADERRANPFVLAWRRGE